MSNRKKLTARKVPNPLAESLWEAQNNAAKAMGQPHVQLNGASARRLRRALRKTVRGNQ